MMTASQWHHIGSKENPADICGQGVAIVHELSNEIGSLKSWCKGPSFLWSNSKVEQNLKEIKLKILVKTTRRSKQNVVSPIRFAM